MNQEQKTNPILVHLFLAHLFLVPCSLFNILQVKPEVPDQFVRQRRQFTSLNEVGR